MLPVNNDFMTNLMTMLAQMKQKPQGAPMQPGMMGNAMPQGGVDPQGMPGQASPAGIGGMAQDKLEPLLKLIQWLKSRELSVPGSGYGKQGENLIRNRLKRYDEIPE